jgi:hypothetical protein
MMLLPYNCEPNTAIFFSSAALEFWELMKIYRCGVLPINDAPKLPLVKLFYLPNYKSLF